MFERKKPPKNTQQPRHRVNEPWMQVFNHPHRVSVGWLLFFVLRFSFPLGAQATCTAASPSGFASSGMRYRPGVAWWWDRGLGGGPISS